MTSNSKDHCLFLGKRLYLINLDCSCLLWRVFGSRSPTSHFIWKAPIVLGTSCHLNAIAWCSVKGASKISGVRGHAPRKKSKSRWKSVQFCAFLLTKKYFFKREKNINQEKRYIAWLGGGFREPWKPPLDPAMYTPGQKKVNIICKVSIITIKHPLKIKLSKLTSFTKLIKTCVSVLP